MPLAYPTLQSSVGLPASRRTVRYSISTYPLTAIPGLLLWLKADAITGVTSGNSFATWTDSSGSGFSMVQNTGGSQPVWNANIVNSKPVVTFSGGTKYMSVANFVLGAFTKFFVYRATGGMLLEHSPNGGTQAGSYHYTPQSDGFDARGTGGSRSGFNISQSLTDNTWRVVTQVMDGTNAGHVAYLNGVSQSRSASSATADPGTSLITDTLFLGARNGASLAFAGDVAEIAIYNAALSTSNRQQVETALGAKYNITITH
jgi:hypothetical protein